MTVSSPTTSNADRHVQVAIIGAGTAGLSARRGAMKAGARSVAMIDPGPYGTTCARVGCMPSKLLIAAADAAHHVRKADMFGVRTAEPQIDGKAVLARVQSERDRFVGFVQSMPITEARQAGQLIEGRATLTSPGNMSVATNDGGTMTLTYDRLIVATGSRPVVPGPFRGLGDLNLTNEEIFELEDLPESLLVIGLGVIGLELGQAFDRLGVRTTLLGRGGSVGPLTDPEIIAEAARVLGEELNLHPDYELHTVQRTAENRVLIRFVDSKGRDRTETYDRVLMAAGRRSNMDRIGIEALGIAPDARGRYDIDPDTLQLGEAPIFVAGDVNGLHPLLHEAADDGHLAGRNAVMFQEIRAERRRAPLAIAFTDPQIALVGQTWRQLEDCEAVAGEVDYGDQGRARVQGINAGKVRIYADKHTDVLLGAELFGPRVEHLAHLLAWAVQQRLTVDAALEMPFYHPVVEEGIRTALRDLNRNLRRGAPIKCRVSELGVGS